jgi:hypothetical protein
MWCEAALPAVLNDWRTSRAPRHQLGGGPAPSASHGLRPRLAGPLVFVRPGGMATAPTRRARRGRHIHTAHGAGHAPAARRQHLAAWQAITTYPEPPPRAFRAQAVRAALCARGALFFEDLLARLRLLSSQLEAALSELAGQGLAACDGFAGLRALSDRTADWPASDARGAGGADGRRGSLALEQDATRLGRVPRRRDRGIEMPSSRRACCWIATGRCFRRLCTRSLGCHRGASWSRSTIHRRLARGTRPAVSLEPSLPNRACCKTVLKFLSFTL